MPPPAELKPLRSKLSALASIIGAGAMLLTMATYTATAVYYEYEHLLFDAKAAAERVSGLVYASPLLWPFQTERLHELVEENHIHDAFIERHTYIDITDIDGEMVASFAPHGVFWSWPHLSGQAVIYDGVNPVGHITVHTDMRGIVLIGFTPLLLSIVIALAVIYVLRVVPLRAIAERETRLAAQERYFRALIENSSDIIAVMTADRRMRFSSPSLAQLLQFDDEEMRRTTLPDVLHPDDVDTLAVMLATITDEPDGAAQAEVRIADKFGAWHTMTVRGRNALAIPDVGGIIVNAHEVTELRAREAELRQAQKMETIGQLTGGVAHDFNNLLTAVIGNLDLLLLDAEQGSEKHRLLTTATRAAERGAELTQRLLAFARQQSLTPVPIDAAQLLDEVQLLLASTLGEGIVVERDIRATGEMCADRAQLEAALINLAINARDAMRGQGKLTFRVRDFEMTDQAVAPAVDLPNGKYIAISVADTGDGMSADVVEKAFDPFFTTKAIGQGSGLGLSMVHGFLKQSQGEATIDTAIGIGTTITLYLPQHQDTPAQTRLPRPGALRGNDAEDVKMPTRAVG